MKFLLQFRSVRIMAITVAILSPFALFSSKLRPLTGDINPLKYVQEIIYPIQYGWNSAVSLISLNFQRLMELNTASIENIALRKENELLRLQQIRLEEEEKENKELRELIDFKVRTQDESVAVELFSSDRRDPFQTVRINRGSRDKIEMGMPLITPGGVLGKVIRVGLFHSDVQILTDANFHLDVLIQRTRTRAILQGTGDGACKLKIHHRSQIKIGDTVVTSGVVGAFPKGIPVGRVTKISYGKEYVSQSIEITPWVQPFSQEYALIILRHDEDIDRIMESTSKGWLENATSANERSLGGRY